MKYPNKDYIEHLRRKYPPGTRLQLSCMEDDFPVPPGYMELLISSMMPDRSTRIGTAGAVLPSSPAWTRSAACPRPKKRPVMPDELRL